MFFVRYFKLIENKWFMLNNFNLKKLLFLLGLCEEWCGLEIINK